MQINFGGREIALKLVYYGPALSGKTTNLRALHQRDAQRFANTYELIPQTFVMPIADFKSATPDFDPRQLLAVAVALLVAALGLELEDAQLLAAHVREHARLDRHAAPIRFGPDLADHVGAIVLARGLHQRAQDEHAPPEERTVAAD